MKEIKIKKVKMKNKKDFFNNENDWKSVKESFYFEEDNYKQITPNKTKYTKLNNNLEDYLSNGEFNGYRIRSGVTFSPIDIVQFKKINLEEPSIDYNNRKNKYYLTNITNNKNSNDKFELELMRPFLKAPDLKHLSDVKSNIACIFPYDKENEIIPKYELSQNFYNIYNFFERYKEDLDFVTKREDGRLVQKEDYGITRVGPYTFKNKHVLLRDNSKWTVTLVKDFVENDFGLKKYPLFDSHIKYISERCDYENNNKIIGYIEDDLELFYVAAILATDIVKDYMLLTNSGRGYSFVNLPFYIPHFSNKEESHLNIANYLKENFNTSFINTDEFRINLNNLYKELIENLTGRKIEEYVPEFNKYSN